MTGSAPAPPYPTAITRLSTESSSPRMETAHLHSHQPVVDHNLLREASGVLVGLSHEWLEGKRAHKSAPMVALYWLLKRLFTYWFIREVLPTLRRDSMVSLRGHPPFVKCIRTRYHQE